MIRITIFSWFKIYSPFHIYFSYFIVKWTYAIDCIFNIVIIYLCNQYITGEETHMKRTIRKNIMKRVLAAALIAGATIFGQAAAPNQAFAAEKIAHIGQVQGAAQYSPYQGKEVEVQGVVTFRSGKSSFFIQDPEGDGNDATSDAIMVYAPDAPCGIGDLVTVKGEVTEYFNAGFRDKKETDLPVTEIKASKVKVIKSLGREGLPKPIVLDKDRMIPRKVIDSDGLKVFNPEKDAIDFWESLEGMRVSIENAKVLGPQRYADLWVVPGTHEGPFNNCGGLSIAADDMHPEHICVYMAGDGGKQYRAKAGDHFDKPITGVVSYAFGNYQVMTLTNQMPPIIDGGLTHDFDKTTIQPDPSKLLIASYNIENFSKAHTSQAKVDRLGKSIVNDLHNPDIITVLELQDNDGKDDTGNTDASQSGQYLIDAVKAAGGPEYKLININPEDGADGGQPGANIRVAYFYNPSRVQLRSGAPEGKAKQAVKWQGGHLTLNPGRIDPTNTIFEHTRKSLAAEFTFNGKDLTIIANHLNSKRGDDTLYGQHQPVKLRSEEKRLKLAADIMNFVDEGLKQDQAKNIMLMGDFNDFEFSPVIKALEGTTMTNLVGHHDIADRYSYFYNGNNQILDNIIVSNNLVPNCTFDIVHVNSPFMPDDRVSDHDPLLVQVDLK